MSVLERIRWGNVARLVVAVAAGLLTAVGPPGCSHRAAPPPPARIPEPPVRRSPFAERTPSRAPELRRARPRHRNRRRAPKAAAPSNREPRTANGERSAPPAPPPPARRPQPRATGSGGEFF